MNELAQKRCKPCEGGTQPFTAEEAKDYGFVDEILSSVDHVTPARTRAVGLAGAR